MKYSLCFFILFILVLKCQTSKNQKYLLEGCINEKTGMVYLLDFYKDHPVDSATIDNGKFYFEGRSDDADFFKLNVKGTNENFPFILENADYKLNVINNQDNITINIEGGDLQLILSQLEGILNSQIRVLNKLRADKGEAVLNGDRDNVQNRIDSLNKLKKIEKLSLFLKYKNTKMAPAIILYAESDVDSLKYYFNMIPYDVKMSKLGQRTQDYIVRKEKINAEAVKVGDVFPNDTLVSDNNVKTVIQDLYSENCWTLFDFWASWCKPCREKHPELISLLDKYTNSSFSIVSISLDKKSENWKKAIFEDKLNWTQLLDSSGNISKNLKISSIPSNFLVDNNGSIIAINKNTKQLNKIIDSLQKTQSKTLGNKQYPFRKDRHKP